MRTRLALPMLLAAMAVWALVDSAQGSYCGAASWRRCGRCAQGCGSSWGLGTMGDCGGGTACECARVRPAIIHGHANSPPRGV